MCEHDDKRGPSPRVYERHPDVFTAEEAAVYLHLEKTATVEWLREKGMLIGHKVGMCYMYHREDLDHCAAHMLGKVHAPPSTRQVNRALRRAGIEPPAR